MAQNAHHISYLANKQLYYKAPKSPEQPLVQAVIITHSCSQREKDFPESKVSHKSNLKEPHFSNVTSWDPHTKPFCQLVGMTNWKYSYYCTNRGDSFSLGRRIVLVWKWTQRKNLCLGPNLPKHVNRKPVFLLSINPWELWSGTLYLNCFRQGWLLCQVIRLMWRFVCPMGVSPWQQDRPNQEWDRLVWKRTIGWKQKVNSLSDMRKGSLWRSPCLGRWGMFLHDNTSKNATFPNQTHSPNNLMEVTKQLVKGWNK